jgi:hypothetical protein
MYRCNETIIIASPLVEVDNVNHDCTKVTNATNLKSTSQLEFYRNSVTMNHQIKK